ncbi:MAG TPA: phosphatase PAP2 family protein [Oscillospiraceae bacterium]|nr:phosphatase PAP2 family protein [Oscillospiraceae bacterium]
MKTWLKEHNHIWVLLYFPIYLLWFCWLEDRPAKECNIISSPLDALIPFHEIFIVPYLLWFAFMAATVGYFFFADRAGFLRLMAFLGGGMTIFLLVSTVYPNGLAIRPTVFPRENVFTDLVRMLYAADTPTNVLPSIHVLNSLGAYSAISNSERLGKRWIRYAALVLTVLIILATMFLKQHSVVDVLAAFLLSGLLYGIVYGRETKRGRVTTTAWETAKQ